MNQTDCLILTTFSFHPLLMITPFNHEENQPEQDFNKAVENEFIQVNCALVRALKQQQHQQ